MMTTPPSSMASSWRRSSVVCSPAFHACGSCWVIPRQGVPADVDPWRQNETVVGQCAAAAQRHCPGADVNGRRRIERQAHAVTGDLVVAKLLRVEVAQACDHGIAKRTGRE